MKTPPTSNAASRKSYGGHYDIFDLDRTTWKQAEGAAEEERKACFRMSAREAKREKRGAFE